MSFLSRGFNQVDQDVQSQNDRRERLSARRVWVKSGSAINVVFLDDEPVRFEEYRLYSKASNRPDFVTRPPSGQKDRFLAAGLKADPKFAWSVVDCTAWKDKKGQEHVNEKKLLVVSADIAKLLRDKRASWGGLKGKAVTIRRKGDKDYGSGSDFELLMKGGQVVTVNMKAFKDVEPFNYEKVLAPPTDDESIRLLANNSKGNENAAAISVDDDDSGLPSGDIPGGADVPPPSEMDTSSSDLPF